jgi:branched-chain amino acid transport system permease protein
VAEQRGTGVAISDMRMSRFERLPWRRIILTVLSIAITIFVVVGAYRTLSLPEGQRYTPELWANFVVEGISQGALYALIALGYSLVYGILKMINFAHGEVFMFGAFGSFFFADAFSRSGFLDDSPYLAIAILFLVAMTISITIAFLLERIAYRPLRSAPRLVPLITAIGASLFLQNTARGFWGQNSRGYPLPSVLDGEWTIGFVTILKIQALILVVSVVLMIGLQLLVSRTRTGRSMRAVAEDREIASLMGIGVDRVIVTTFVIGGALAGIAGVLFAMLFGSVDFFMGFKPGIAAFTAAVLGGIGSISGAALGGLLLGVLRSVGPALILTGYGVPSPFQLRDAFVFVVLVFVLIFRPNGLLGSSAQEKV